MEPDAPPQGKDANLRDTLMDITRERHDRLYRELKDLFEDYGSSVSQDTEFIVDQYMSIKKEKVSLEDEIMHLKQENALLQTKIFESSSNNAQESDSSSGASVEVLDRELKKATVQLVQAMEEGELHRRNVLALKQSQEESQRTASALKAALERSSGVIRELNKGIDEVSEELRNQALKTNELEAKLQRAETLSQQQHSTIQALRTTEASLKGQLEATGTELKQSLDFIAEYMPVLVPLVAGKTKAQSVQQSQPTSAQQPQQGFQQAPKQTPQQVSQQVSHRVTQQAQQQQLPLSRSNQQQLSETLLADSATNHFNQVLSRAGIPLYSGAPVAHFVTTGSTLNHPVQHPYTAQQGMFPSPPASGQSSLQQAQPIPQSLPTVLQQQHRMQLQQQLVMQHVQQKQQKQQQQQQQQQREKQHQYLVQQHQEQQQLQQQQQEHQHHQQRQQQQLQLQKMRIQHYHQQQQLQNREEQQQQQQPQRHQVHQQLQQRLPQNNTLPLQLQQPRQLHQPQQQSQLHGLTIQTHSISMNNQRPDLGARSSSGSSTHELSSIPRQEPILQQQQAATQGRPVYFSPSSAPATPTISTPVSQQAQGAVAQNADLDDVDKLRQLWLLYHVESSSIVQHVQQIDSSHCTPEQRERQKQVLMERQKKLVNAMNNIRRRLIDMNETGSQPVTPTAIELHQASSTTPVTPVFAIDLTDNTPATPTDIPTEGGPSSSRILEAGTSTDSEHGLVSTSAAVTEIPFVSSCTVPESSALALATTQTSETTPSSLSGNATVVDQATVADSQIASHSMVAKPAGDTHPLNVTSAILATLLTTTAALGATLPVKPVSELTPISEPTPVSDPTPISDPTTVSAPTPVPDQTPISDPTTASNLTSVPGTFPKEGSPSTTAQPTSEPEKGLTSMEGSTDQSLNLKDDAMDVVQEEEEDGSLPADTAEQNLDQRQPISPLLPIPSAIEPESAQVKPEVTLTGTITGNAKKRRLIIDWDDDDSDDGLWDDVVLHEHKSSLRNNHDQIGTGSPRDALTVHTTDQSRKRGKQDSTQNDPQEPIRAASTTPQATADHEKPQDSELPGDLESTGEQPADTSLSDQTEVRHKEDADSGIQDQEQKPPSPASAQPLPTTDSSSQPTSTRTTLAMPERSFFSTTRGDFKMGAAVAERSKPLDGSILSSPWKNDIACLPSFKKRSSPVQIKVPRSFVTGNSAVAGLPVKPVSQPDPVKRGDLPTSNRPESNVTLPKRPTDPRLRAKNNSNSGTSPARSATQSPTATPQPTSKPAQENQPSSTTNSAVRPTNITRISFDAASQKSSKSIFNGGPPQPRPLSSPSWAATADSNSIPRPRHALPSKPVGGAGATPARSVAQSQSP
ncbi:hypothetical protein BGZ68_000525 [Mortierella alpina]|nr:hypothetical protein BGZ68_000525 [Mortierella alpina]